MAAYGGTCKCCGEEDIEFLVMDHIDGDGADRKKNGEPKLGEAFYKWIIDNKFPDHLQTLCHNCNWSKGTGTMCHHQRLRLPHPDQLNLFE